MSDDVHDIQMIALHSNVATLVADMRHVVSDVAEIRASLRTELPALAKRVDDLERAHERAKTKLITLGTGGGIVVSGLAWLAEHLFR